MSTHPDLAFNVLGELDVTFRGERITIGRPRQRALLAVLLLSIGETVSTDRLIDGVWGDRFPASAAQLVRVYVSQLRALLGEDIIATRARGYAFVDMDANLDLTSFDELVASARVQRDATHLAGALVTYDSALRLWRGSMLADTPLEGEAAVRVGDVERTLLTVREERIDVALSLGRGAELVDELERLVTAEPLREHLRAQQMIALYQAGRQADALASYRDGRQRLAEELGLNPNPELQDLERAILQQDPTLTAPTHPQGFTSGRHSKVLLAVTGLILAALTGAIVLRLVLDGSSEPTSGHALPSDSLGALDPVSGVLRGSVPLHAMPATLTIGGGHVWVAAAQQRTLSEVDTTHLRIDRTVGLSAVPHELIYANGSLWAANGFDGTISRIGSDGPTSPPSRPEVHTTGRLALGFGAGSLWVGSQDNILSRLDPTSGNRTASLHGVVTPEAVAVGFGSVWVAQATRVDLLRVDPRGNRISRRIPLGGTATAVTTGAGSVWALTPTQNKLWKIDPRTNAVTAAINVAAATSAVVANGNQVWVASESTGTLERIDPRNDRVAQSITLGNPLAGIALGPGRLWVATR